MASCKVCGLEIRWAEVEDDRRPGSWRWAAIDPENPDSRHVCPGFVRERRKGIHLQPGRVAREIGALGELYGGRDDD